MEKTEDSLFDEIAEVHVAADGTVQASLVEDPAQEMEAAVADMVRSWREFRDLNANGPIAAHTYQWWKCLCYLALAEDRLKECFLGRDRSPASIKQYHKFRMKMVFGRRYRADA
jgi:hypothetical protein